VTRMTSLKAVAERALPKLKTLQTDIAADLKERDKKSKSRAAIEDLGDEVDGRIRELSDILKRYGLLKPVHLNPQKHFDDKIKALMQESAKDLKDKKDSDNVPHQFEKRNITKTLKDTQSAFKSIVSSCDDCEKAAAAGDKDEALKNLKAAKAEYDAVKTTVEDIDRAAKRFASDLANSKDKKTIDDAISQMAKMGAVGEKKLKQALEAMKKAKWTPVTA
jgi:hypothetical protein